MRRALLRMTLGVALLASPVSARAPAPPRRIISLNLCADQYLLLLADRDQIAGLTRNADDPAMSAAAGRARGLRKLRGSAEEVLAIDPDLIVGIGSRYGGILAALPGNRYPLLDLNFADSYADIVAQVGAVAAAVGHPARGRALIAAMDHDLAALGPPRPHGVAADYQRRGFLTGAGTLVDELMRRVGLVNLATKLGRPPLSQLSLEELVAARPDYLIVEGGEDRVVDQGTEMLRHPALRGIPRLRLPPAATVCGSPAFVRAAQALAAQLHAKRRTGAVTPAAKPE